MTDRTSMLWRAVCVHFPSLTFCYTSPQPKRSHPHVSESSHACSEIHRSLVVCVEPREHLVTLVAHELRVVDLRGEPPGVRSAVVTLGFPAGRAPGALGSGTHGRLTTRDAGVRASCWRSLAGAHRARSSRKLRKLPRTFLLADQSQRHAGHLNPTRRP